MTYSGLKGANIWQMTGKSDTRSDRKTERLRSALRENLKRRKDQARARSVDQKALTGGQGALTDRATSSTAAHESARIDADKQK
jgi:hypothetical protein